MRAVLIGRSGQLARCLMACVPDGVQLTAFGCDAFDLAGAAANVDVLANVLKRLQEPVQT